MLNWDTKVCQVCSKQALVLQKTNNKACNIPKLIFNQNTVIFLFLQIAQFEKELSVFQWQNHNELDQEKNPICALLYVCK